MFDETSKSAQDDFLSSDSTEDPANAPASPGELSNSTDGNDAPKASKGKQAKKGKKMPMEERLKLFVGFLLQGKPMVEVMARMKLTAKQFDTFFRHTLYCDSAPQIPASKHQAEYFKCLPARVKSEYQKCYGEQAEEGLVKISVMTDEEVLSKVCDLQKHFIVLSPLVLSSNPDEGNQD